MPKKEEVITPEREKVLEEKNRQLTEALRPFSDNLPYDRNRVVNETKFFMNMAANGIIETGKRLILLKAKEGHGGFMKACDEIGVTRSTAGRFMKAAEKVANYPTLGNLGRSKVYALLDVPDEELKEFEETGLLFGADRDEVDSWGVRELKEHIRKYRKQIGKGAKQLEDLREENAELKARLSAPVTEADATKRLEEAYEEFCSALALLDTVRVDDVTSRYLVRRKIALLDHMSKESSKLSLDAARARNDVDTEGLDSDAEDFIPGHMAEKIGKKAKER